MSAEIANVETPKAACELAGAERLKREFQHLRSDWWWLLLYGVLLTMCGTVAIVVPPLATAGTMVVLGIVLIIGGAATVVLSFWAGKWSGVLLHLLVGVLYLVAGFAIFDTPIKATLITTLFLAAMFIVVGAFRILAAMMIQFPHWGWALLNGFVTLLLGLIIYRRFPESAIWVLGLLVGIEMLFNGWNWIALSLAVRNIPEEKAA
jgi:uncharacterized membrane protein HdeD (DUF308 family)